MSEPTAARLARIQRLTTLGWVGGGGERVPWLFACGWLYAGFRDSGRPVAHVYRMTPRAADFTMAPAPRFRMR